ncbi:hypothetical protein QJR26_17955 (plasmid) [Clostridium baratii]
MSEKVKDKFKNLYYRLKMSFHNGNVMKVLFTLFAVIVIYNCLDTAANASGILDYNGKNSPFDGINDGWGVFMDKKYRMNYYLDAGDISSIDLIGKAINGIANVFFNMAVFIAWIGINVFNLCFNNNITDSFASVLDSISNAFTSGVFGKFYIVMFMFSLASIVIMFAKRNYSALFGQCMAMLIIMVSVIVLGSTGARSFVVESTKFSKDIGATLVSSINDNGNGKNNTKNSTSEMLGTMWGNLVHIPWMTLEFNGDKSVKFEKGSDDVTLYEDILSKHQSDSEREKITKDAIGEVSYASRLGTTMVLVIITGIKVFVIIVLGVLQIFLQIVAIGIILVSPLFFLLAIVPQFGGTDLLKWIFKKFIGVELGIILLSFVIALLLLVDTVTLDFFMNLGASFAVAMVIQCVCWVLVIIFRKQIMSSLMELQNKVGSGTGKYFKPGDKLMEKGEDALKGAAEPVKRGAINVKDSLVYGTKYAATYGKNKAKMYAAQKMADIIDKANERYKKKHEPSSEEFENNKNGTNTSAGENTKNYKGEPIDFEELKAKKKAEREAENIKENMQDKPSGTTSNKENESNTKKENDIEDSKNTNNEKIQEEKEKQNSDEGTNIKAEEIKNENLKNNVKNAENTNKDKEDTIKNDAENNVVDLNEERAKKGKEPVNSEAIKEDIRKNLNDEIKSKDIKQDPGTVVNKPKNNGKKKVQKDRADKLKEMLGVDKKQLKKKEKTYNKELNNLKKDRKKQKKLNKSK